MPVAVPAGFRPDRAGVVTAGGGPRTGVRSWTDGRGWFTVQATADWDGDRLFGDLGPDVRPIELDGAGTAYVSATASGSACTPTTSTSWSPAACPPSASQRSPPGSA